MIPKEKHFIDSCLFVSIIKMDNNMRNSSKYFARLRSGVYKGYISFSVYAEVIFIIKRDIEKDKWATAIYEFLKLIDDNNIDTLTPRIETLMKSLHQLKNLERRIMSTDIRLLADAISLNIPHFATLDTKLGNAIFDETNKNLIKIRSIGENLFVKYLTFS